jgi:hypothetical protein
MPSPTPAPAGGYYVFPASGTIQRQTNPLLAAGLKASGWAGPYASMTAAHNAINSSVPQKIKSDAGSLTGVNAIGSFFNRLTSQSTWLRAGEFGIGFLFVYVSAKAMFPAQVNAIATPAKKVAKAAAFVK